MLNQVLQLCNQEALTLEMTSLGWSMKHLFLIFSEGAFLFRVAHPKTLFFLLFLSITNEDFPSIIRSDQSFQIYAPGFFIMMRALSFLRIPPGC